MKRRQFIRLLGAAAAWPLEVHAQQAAMQLVAWLASSKTDGTYIVDFRTAGGEALAISIPGRRDAEL
jgi:hypothetical protein